MTPTSLVAVVALRTGKIYFFIKNDFRCFWKRRKFGIQNGILHFVFALSQSSEIVLQS